MCVHNSQQQHPLPRKNKIQIYILLPCFEKEKFAQFTIKTFLSLSFGEHCHLTHQTRKEGK